jgi:hypothetical protein
MKRLAIMCAIILTSFPANALLLDVTLGEVPLGPFAPTDNVIIYGSATNTSSTQTMTICEGVCLGETTTFSLGAFASIPNGYSFFFGNGGDTSLGFLDGQLAGTLAPLNTEQFIFGEFTPNGGFAPPGLYSFGVQLQIFAATPDRPFHGGPSFGGSFQVIPATPLPPALSLFATGLGLLGFLGWRRRLRTA